MHRPHCPSARPHRAAHRSSTVIGPDRIGKDSRGAQVCAAHRVDAEDPMRDEKDEDKGIKPARPARNRAAAAVVLSPDAELCVCVRMRNSCLALRESLLLEVCFQRARWRERTSHPAYQRSGRAWLGWSLRIRCADLLCVQRAYHAGTWWCASHRLSAHASCGSSKGFR